MKPLFSIVAKLLFLTIISNAANPVLPNQSSPYPFTEKNKIDQISEIPLEYGVLYNDVSSGNSPVAFTFSGDNGDVIRIGASFMMAVLVIESPSGEELYNENIESLPESKLILELTLAESGTYTITFIPQMGFLQYLLAIYKVEPIDALPLTFDENVDGNLNNWGVAYHSFNADAGDVFELKYDGFTTDVEISIITPSGNEIICNENITDFQLEHTHSLTENGLHYLKIDSEFSGAIDYTLFANLNNSSPQTTIPYTPGTVIETDILRKEKQVFTFDAEANQELFVAVVLEAMMLELRSPSGALLLSIDHSSPMSFVDREYEIVMLPGDGTYELSIWHDNLHETESLLTMCATILPEPFLVEKDSTYEFTLQPFGVMTANYKASKGEVVRLRLPYGTTFISPANDTLTISRGEIFEPSLSGTYRLFLENYNNEPAEIELWIRSIQPPAEAQPVEIGEPVTESISFYDTKSISYEGNKNDTIYIQCSLTEVFLNPGAGSIKSSDAWLYIGTPSGEKSRIKGDARGMLYEHGYGLTYYFKKRYILPETGTYFFTALIDKLVMKNPTRVDMRLDQSGAKIEIPFNNVSDYEMPGVYSCSVPEGLEDLYVVVKKNNFLGYDATWRGIVSLNYNGQEWQDVGFSNERNDFIFYIENPEAGEYTLPISAFGDDEIRGSILFTNQLPELRLNQWNMGVVSRAYGSDWKVLTLTNPPDTLFVESEGYGLWSSIVVTYGYLGNSGQRWVFKNMGEGYNIKGAIPDPPAGRYYVRYVDSAVLQDEEGELYSHSEDQHRQYLIYAGINDEASSYQLRIRDISSRNIGQGMATFTLTGSGFMPETKVQLVTEDEQDTLLIENNTSSPDGRELIVTYDFTSAGTGNYFLEAINPDTLVRYNEMIKVQSDSQTSVWASLLSSDLYRVGRNQRCVFTIKNNGPVNIDYAGGYFYADNEHVRLLFTDGSGLIYDADSLNEALNGEVINRIPFFIRNWRVGETFELTFNITSKTIPDNYEFDVGLVVGALSKSEYNDLQEDMASAWYDFICEDEFIPVSIQECAKEFGFLPFLNLWNGGEEELFKSATNVSISEHERLQQRMEYWVENAMWGTDKIANYAMPQFTDRFGDENNVLGIISNPYSALKAGINVVWDKAKDISNALDGILFGGPDDSDDKKKVNKKKKSVNSTTPEDKYGPVGYGLGNGNGYIDSLNLFEYRIDYWNKEDASAPAAIVYIRDTIDTDFNLETLRFTEVGFLKWKQELEGGQYFNIDVDCRPDMPYIVNIEGNVDYETREVYWVHTTLDPETMELPDDPLSGFLPPIDSTGYQLGWVDYTIAPHEALPHGTAFENQAFVNFDGVGKWGPAPPYGPYTNIFDFEPPVSFIEELAVVTQNETFNLSLAGSDEGAGIDRYKIYVAENRGVFNFWKETSESSIAFNGRDGNHYAFYSIAVDGAGNVEASKTSADTFTEIDVQSGVKSVVNRGIKIVPNPTAGNLSFKGKEPGCMLLLRLYDYTGRMVVAEQVEASEVFNIRFLPNGIYFYIIELDKGISYEGKIVKMHH